MTTLCGALVHAFSVDGERGNSAFVFETLAHERVAIDACIAMATGLQSEVTWVQREAAPSQIVLRFFTPGGEIAFCGHGTLAAAAWLANRDGSAADWLFDIGGTPVRVEQDARGRWSYLQEEAATQPIDGGEALVDAALALGLPDASAIRGAGAKLARSVGAPREKLFVELPDAAGLRDIAIDAARRDALCERLGTTGVYVFSVCHTGPAPRIVARHFPIRCGSQEDMATGGIAPTAVRHAGFVLAAGEVIIDQGGPDCRNARLVVSAARTGTARRVAGECVVGRDTPFADVIAPTPEYRRMNPKPPAGA
jgi:PhzF family phenazine biosynthesis protein